MRRKISSKARRVGQRIAEETQSQFERLFAPKLMQALKADLRGEVRLRSPQRRAMHEMLNKFMPAAGLKRAFASLRRVASDRRVKATRSHRASRSRRG